MIIKTLPGYPGCALDRTGFFLQQPAIKKPTELNEFLNPLFNSYRCGVKRLYNII